MKPARFAVSVQYGAGYHYFLNYRETYEEAEHMRKTHQARLDLEFKSRPGPRKGAKGIAYVWEMKAPTQVVGPHSKWPREERHAED